MSGDEYDPRAWNEKRNKEMLKAVRNRPAGRTFSWRETWEQIIRPFLYGAGGITLFLAAVGLVAWLTMAK